MLAALARRCLLGLLRLAGCEVGDGLDEGEGGGLVGFVALAHGDDPEVGTEALGATLEGRHQLLELGLVANERFVVSNVDFTASLTL